jgi:hypothetical protein
MNRRWFTATGHTPTIRHTLLLGLSWLHRRRRDRYRSRLRARTVGAVTGAAAASRPRPLRSTWSEGTGPRSVNRPAIFGRRSHHGLGGQYTQASDKVPRRSSAKGYGVRAVKTMPSPSKCYATANLAAMSGHASNDKRSADISSLDNLRIKSLRPSIIRWRMNDT